MLKIRKGDMVQVVKGKDVGKKGKILQVLAAEQRALVEGVNFVKKHRRQTRQDQQGGIVSVERPLHIAKVMLLCKQCNKPVRVGFKTLEDKTKVRFCKSCKEVI